MNDKVKVISITQSLIKDDNQDDLTPEELIVYIARVSNPQNQNNHATGAKLLHYCMKHGHWSPFEMVDMTVEINTSRAIAAQILRHRSFSFQEFSQRYSDVNKMGDLNIEMEMRAKHIEGNRQGSGEDIGGKYPKGSSWNINSIAKDSIATSIKNYNTLLEAGVAPECARMILPLATPTKVYMKGSVRSWIHYMETRTTMHTQKEHRELAYQIEELFSQQFPIIHEAMNLKRQAGLVIPQ